MDAVDRIFDLVEKKYTDQKDFASELGIHASIVSRWKKRESNSWKKYLEKISAVLETSPEYILTGKEEREYGQEKEPLAEVSSQDMRLLSAYHRASPDIQWAVQRLLGIEGEPVIAQSETAV